MVYFKVLINTKRKKEDDVYPVVIRLTYNRATTFISTGVRIHLDQWDEKKSQVRPNIPNSQQLNLTIHETFSKLQKLALRLEQDGEFSFSELQKRLISKPTLRKGLSLNEFANVTISNLIAEGKSGNALVYKAAWSRLENFIGGKPFHFNDLTLRILQDFKRHLIAEGAKTNTVSNYFRTIRALYNRALREGYVKEEQYPFKHIKIESEPTLKRAVSFSELKRLLNCETQIATTEWHSVNFFFLSLSLIGISFTDLAYIKKTDIVDDRVIYIRRKTGKVYSIKLTSFAIEILNRYPANNSRYLLPVLSDSTI